MFRTAILRFLAVGSTNISAALRVSDWMTVTLGKSFGGREDEDEDGIGGDDTKGMVGVGVGEKCGEVVDVDVDVGMGVSFRGEEVESFVSAFASDFLLMLSCFEIASPSFFECTNSPSSSEFFFTFGSTLKKPVIFPFLLGIDFDGALSPFSLSFPCPFPPFTPSSSYFASIFDLTPALILIK